MVFVLAPLCILTVALWLFTKSWILNNVLAISLIVFFLTDKASWKNTKSPVQYRLGDLTGHYNGSFTQHISHDRAAHMCYLLRQRLD